MHGMKETTLHESSRLFRQSPGSESHPSDNPSYSHEAPARNNLPSALPSHSAAHAPGLFSHWSDGVRPRESSRQPSHAHYPAEPIASSEHHNGWNFDASWAGLSGSSTSTQKFSEGDRSAQQGDKLSAEHDSSAAPAEDYKPTTHTTRQQPHAVAARRSGPNSILFNLPTSGASQKTANQDNLKAGRRASDAMAKRDMAYMESHQMHNHMYWFRKIGQKYGIPPALLAAIASRETRGGKYLTKDGRSPDEGNQGYGLMQVDAGSHRPRGGPYSYEHIEQAAQILKQNLGHMKHDHPGWSQAWKLRGMVAAYNFGAQNVQTQAGIDQTSDKNAPNDYSSDVWERARYYALHHPTMLGGH